MSERLSNVLLEQPNMYAQFNKIKESFNPLPNTKVEYNYIHPDAMERESTALRKNRNLEEISHAVEHYDESSIIAAEIQEMASNIDEEVKIKKCNHLLTKAKTCLCKCTPQITLCFGGSIAINSILLCVNAPDPTLYIPSAIINVAMLFSTYKSTKNEYRMASEELSRSSLQEENILDNLSKATESKSENIDNINENFTKKLAEVQGLTIKELNEEVKKTEKSIWRNRLLSWGCSIVNLALPTSALIALVNQIWDITAAEELDPTLIYYAIISLGINGFWSIFATIYSNKFWSKRKESYETNLANSQEKRELLLQRSLEKFRSIEIKTIKIEEEIVDESLNNPLLREQASN